uniref:Ribonuclease H-like domain, reverse transcriptase, RNA-dependent DNA polymerase n=1 Tax=Tanacetum cinerariifolium TaxID=118510 RepID=A0A699HAZ1_TANCI|nr:ribonuclease H-like domain, reverse transcriptase, RNA-dependent DNA polymerase [Tanacetum cinerariifolium]
MSEGKNKEIIVHREVASLSQFQCPILKSTNYTIWALRIKTILSANGLWDIIEPADNAQLDIKKDMAATVYLYQALPEDMILQVASCNSAKEIWKALQTRRIGVDRVQKARLQTLKTKFEMLKMKEDDSIDEFTAKLNSIPTRASGLGSTFDQQTLVRKLLSSVPKRFIQIVAAIEQFTDLEETTLDEAIGRLKAFDERVNLFNGSPSDNQDKLLFSNHDNSSSHEKGFKNGGQEKFRTHFKEVDEKISGRVRFGDGSYVKIKGKGSILLECKNKEQRVIPNVYYIPDLKKTESGKKYMFLLVDDCTRYMWVYFLKSKYEAFETFKEFKLKVENEVGKKLKSFRTDRGGEFTSREFTRYCKENDILRQLIAPYSPQQNDNPSKPPPYTYEPNSEDSIGYTSSIASSSRSFDHTPVRGYINLSEIYNRAPEVQSDELLLLEEEPRNYKEAAQDKNNQKAIGLKWVFKTKRDGNRKIIKHKARLVAKGYVKEHVIDYEKFFAPVARMETVRLILALLAYHGWEVHHLDVKSAFLHGELKEEVYVTQPEGFKKPRNENKVYRLVKVLYGLKQAPRTWNMKLDQTLKSLNFRKCTLEQAIYTRVRKDSMLLVGVYVDDLIVTGSSNEDLQKFKSQMEERFKMSDLSLLAYYLGIEVTQTEDGISIKQTGYTNKILKEARMVDCNETKIPMDPGTKLIKTGG